MEPRELRAGDVVQLSPESTKNPMFAGCMLTVTEPKAWGAQGYVQGLGEDGKPSGGLIGAMSSLTTHFDSTRFPIAPQKFPSPNKPYVKAKRQVWHCAKSKKYKRTLASMIFTLPDGRRFHYTNDFGYGYPEDSAHYMFHEGNYACDCNRSIFINEHLRANNLPEMEEFDCGDAIAMTEFRIEQIATA